MRTVVDIAVVGMAVWGAAGISTLILLTDMVVRVVDISRLTLLMDLVVGVDILQLKLLTHRKADEHFHVAFLDQGRHIDALHSSVVVVEQLPSGT